MRTIDQTLPDSEQPAGAKSRRAPCLYMVVHARDAANLPSRHVLDCDEVRIGRGSVRSTTREQHAVSLVLPDRWMSKLPHATLQVGLSRCTVQDANSRNGIEVNGERAASTVLNDGDIIAVGKALFLFRDNVALAPDEARDYVADLSGSPALLTLKPDLRDELERVCSVARSPTPILITAPTGSGKELLAKEIHEQSQRTGPLVPVNCGAIASTLIEAELFGHRKGAFSGATEDRVGLIAASSKGTLFLDEIADLPLGAQAALLRVLQDHEVRRVGDTTTEKVDLRVIAATHHDLEAMVAAGSFREDLYARIAGATVSLPSLAERREDLGILVTTLLARMGALQDFAGFDVSALTAMLAYSWPRNIRELEHALSSALSLANGAVITLDHLPSQVRTGDAPSQPTSDDALRIQLTRLLDEHQGNVTRVAEVLGKKRQQIQKWCKRLDIDAASFRG